MKPVERFLLTSNHVKPDSRDAKLDLGPFGKVLGTMLVMEEEGTADSLHDGEVQIVSHISPK